MSEQYQEVVTDRWGDRFAQSWIAALLGVGLFFASFFVLYWNEGRIDFSEIAKTAIEISSTAPNSAAQGKLVSTTGTVTSSQKLGDYLFVKRGDYIVLDRRVEMYAWDEEQKTETKKSLIDNSETKTTTYTYHKEWTSNPDNSSSFKYSESHKNPRKEVDGFHYTYRVPGSDRVIQHVIPEQIYKVPDAKVGIFRLNMPEINVSSLPDLTLQRQNLELDESISLDENYLYAGTSSLSNPQIGDLRIFYKALPAKAIATVFGQLNSPDQITPYLAKGKHSFYELFPGSREQAIAKFRSDYLFMLWTFRFGGFLAMWFGMNFVMAPLSEMLSFIPFIKSFTQNISLLTSFVGAFVLSTITILVSMLLHHPMALILAIATTIIAMQIFRRARHA